MTPRTVLISTIMLAALSATFTAAATPKDTALLDGGHALTAEDIAERYVTQSSRWALVPTRKTKRLGGDT